jgi:alpha-galactosidase
MMSRMANITIIGAGSAAFSLALITDICATKSLWGSTLTLMDISRERADTVASLAERYRKESGVALRIVSTTDRKKALEGAEFVVCTVKIGGYDPLEAERAIAGEHGYYRGIGDRVSCYYGGVGAYHQLAFFLDLARDMESICPGAYLIETSNPVFEGATLLSRHTKIKVVGVCHGHFGYKRLAEALGLAPDEISAQVAGVNHCVWLTDFSHKGRDAYPLIDEWIEKRAARFWESEEYRTAEHPWMIEQVSPGAVDAYRLYGLFPIGDATRSATPWWHHGTMNEKRRWYGRDGGFDSEIGWPTYLAWCRQKIAAIEELAREEGTSVLERHPLVPTGEQHIPIVDAISNGKEMILELNIPNNGAISGIADDVVVEIPALVSSRGIQGVHVGALPPRLMNNVILPRVLRMENILDAFVSGDRGTLVLMLMDDPRTRSFDQAKKLIDTLLSQPWNEQAAAHYRA